MTLTYGDAGTSYGAVTWSYDGTELNLGPYDPTVFLDAEGPYIVARMATGRLAALAATGIRPAYGTSGRYPPILTATNRLEIRAAQGALRSYTAIGVIEHGD